MLDDNLTCPNCGEQASGWLEYIEREDVFKYTIRCSCGTASSVTYGKADIVEYMGKRNERR